MMMGFASFLLFLSFCCCGKLYHFFGCYFLSGHRGSHGSVELAGGSCGGRSGGSHGLGVPCDALGIVNAEMMESTTRQLTSVHVAFSRKVLVWRTPITELAAPNCDERPPPLDFWIRTMPMSRMATITVNTIMTTCISILIF